jgi:hypothetical protein
MASSICKNFMLSPLSISDINPSFKAPFAGFSLILNFEIITKNNRLTCIIKAVVIPEKRCLDEIQQATQADVYFPVQEELKKEIIRNTTTRSTYIVLDMDGFRLTSSPFGTYACVGQVSVTTSDNMKRLHDHFSLRWPTFFYIFSISYRLSDTILTIATEESSTFMLSFNFTNMDQEIFKLIPQILPNIAHANAEPTSFDLFFTKYVNASQDLALSRLKLTQVEIIRLECRHRIYD